MTVTVEAPPRLEEELLEVLGSIKDPCSVRNRTPLSLLEMAIVDKVEVDDGGKATITMMLTDPSCVFFFEMGKEITDRVGELQGVTEVDVRSVGDRWWEPERMSPAVRERLLGMRGARDRRKQTVKLGRPVGAERRGAPA
jgi:ATP-binding protein involved in chromosome partitioning